jgi:hypothetical protein
MKAAAMKDEVERFEVVELPASLKGAEHESSRSCMWHGRKSARNPKMLGVPGPDILLLHGCMPEGI